jgi:hypothetical protein
MEAHVATTGTIMGNNGNAIQPTAQTTLATQQLLSVDIFQVFNS